MKYPEFGIVKICSSGDLEVFPCDSADVSIDLLHSVCDPFDIVRSGVDPSLLIVLDDNGKINHLPINPLATLIYGQYPRDFVVGDVFLGTDFNEDPYADPDFYALPQIRLEATVRALERFSVSLGRKIKVRKASTTTDAPGLAGRPEDGGR